MKKIINGKKYDTETATKLASWDNGIYGNDFRSCSEELYKKKTGEFFLFGEGGPMSTYSKTRGNTTSGSSEIIPLTSIEAAEWFEEKGDADDYESVFGDVEE